MIDASPATVNEEKKLNEIPMRSVTSVEKGSMLQILKRIYPGQWS